MRFPPRRPQLSISNKRYVMVTSRLRGEQQRQPLATPCECRHERPILSLRCSILCLAKAASKLYDQGRTCARAPRHRACTEKARLGMPSGRCRASVQATLAKTVPGHTVHGDVPNQPQLSNGISCKHFYTLLRKVDGLGNNAWGCATPRHHNKLVYTHTLEDFCQSPSS